MYAPVLIVTAPTTPAGATIVNVFVDSDAANTSGDAATLPPAPLNATGTVKAKLAGIAGDTVTVMLDVVAPIDTKAGNAENAVVPCTVKPVLEAAAA